MYSSCSSRVTSTQTIFFKGLLGTGSLGQPPRLSHSSWAVSTNWSPAAKPAKFLKCRAETVGLLGTRAQDVYLDFHTAPELWKKAKSKTPWTYGDSLRVRGWQTTPHNTCKQGGQRPCGWGRAVVRIWVVVYTHWSDGRVTQRHWLAERAADI